VILNRLGSIARNNLHIPIKLEQASAEYDGEGIFFIHVPEQFDKPVYLRGGTIYDSYYRSAGQTHKMSRQQVHDMIAAKEGVAFEDRAAATGLNSDQILPPFGKFFFELYKAVGACQLWFQNQENPNQLKHMVVEYSLSEQQRHLAEELTEE